NISIFVVSAVDIFGDSIANKMKEIINAGKVVQPIFFIWSNKSTCKMDDAIFVVSDSGDILSPKNAPETIAPAVIASEISIALAIPMKATPIVPTVVNELPTLTPTIAQTTNTITKKNFGVTISNPT